jgi:hypothetical protein
MSKELFRIELRDDGTQRVVLSADRFTFDDEVKAKAEDLSYKIYDTASGTKPFKLSELSDYLGNVDIKDACIGPLVTGKSNIEPKIDIKTKLIVLRELLDFLEGR